ncbi:lipopolysaccharide biosynthesis protein [Natrialba taiwanensis]|uniref:Polysaccharide biosynthesis protein n=1 Tax=Natrialba taiwanensis DSM 12281 TaxID=1230458 RepID=L9ZTM0_9EURY|nr:flippase [Natrialba taiwanensis]ELY89431.1 polysaccharide biosynthesis protein [Natrialba taiwanensis DSM 12281]
MKRSITSGFLSIVSIKFLLISLDFLSSPLLTRFLGKGYGDYAVLMSIFAIYMIFVSSGVGDGVRKYVAEERDRDHWDEHVVGFYLRLAILLAAVGCFGLALAVQTGFVTARLGTSYRTYFYLLSLLVFTSQFREYTRRTLMGFGLERYSEPLLFLDKILFIIVGVGLASLGHGVPGVLIGHMVGAVTTSIVGIALINRTVSLRTALTRLPPKDFPRRELFTFNALSIVLILCLTSLYELDVMMLGVLGTTQETAYYKISLTIAEFLWIVPLALQNVLLHSTSNIWSNHDRERIDSIAARVTRYTLLFTLLLAIGIGSLAPVALPIVYPAEYIASYVPILLLLPGCVGFALARPILAIGQGKGDLRILIASTGAAAVGNIVLNGLLIPRYGMYGAGVATSLSYGFMFVFHVWSAREIGFDPVTGARIPQVVFAGGLAAIPIGLLARVLGDSFLSLAVVPPVGAAVFLAAALLVGALDVDEIIAVLEAAPDPIGALGSTLRAELDVADTDHEADGETTMAGGDDGMSPETTPSADNRREAETSSAGTGGQSQTAVQATDECSGSASGSESDSGSGAERQTLTNRNWNQLGDATTTIHSQTLADSRTDASAAGERQRLEEREREQEQQRERNAATGDGSASDTDVHERLETLETGIERQNDRLESQRQTIEQLIDELRRGR